MNKYVHLIFISSDWEFFHRQRLFRTMIDKFCVWSDFVFVQEPLSISINLFFEFKRKFVGYFTGKYKYKEIEKGIKLFTPIAIFHHLLWSKIKFIKYLDVILLCNQINIFIKKRLSDRKVILWVYTPEHYLLVKKLKYDYLVYDLYDNYIYNIEGKLIKDNTYYNQELIKICNLILTTGFVMYKQAIKLNKNSIYLPNANNVGEVNFKFDNSICTEISNIRGSIIGYLGNIRNWIDFDLIELLLNEFRDSKIVFVGSISRSAKRSIRKLRKYSNLILTGNKKLELVPYYLKSFDVGIIPFRLTKFTEGVSPYKFYDYLVANIPIVTTNLPDLKLYKDYIGYSETNDQFVQNCKIAIDGGFKNKINKFPEIAKKNTYEKRVKVLSKVYKNILNIPQKY